MRVAVCSVDGVHGINLRGGEGLLEDVYRKMKDNDELAWKRLKYDILSGKE